MIPHSDTDRQAFGADHRVFPFPRNDGVRPQSQNRVHQGYIGDIVIYRKTRILIGYAIHKKIWGSFFLRLDSLRRQSKASHREYDSQAKHET